MKKMCLLLLSAVLVISLAACSSGSSPSGSSGAPEAAPPPTEASVTAGSESSAPEAEKASVESVAKTKVYVTPQWVRSVIDGEQPQSENYVILEASWGEPGEEYLAKHVPGAVHMNTDSIEEEVYWNIRTGEEITKLMKDYGITKDTTVIVYGNDSGAERVAFVMLWAGVEEVHMLDGGLAAWERAGFATDTGNVEPKATEAEFGVTIPAHPEYVLSMPAEVLEKQKNENFRLVSIRSWEEFIGETSGYSYIERKGEPAGAVWGHDEFDYYDENRMVKDLAAIQDELWKDWDITKDNEISFYCGTGWRACIPFLICYENGWDNITLYDGGWFVWQMDEALPVQIGDPR